MLFTINATKINCESDDRLTGLFAQPNLRPLRTTYRNVNATICPKSHPTYCYNASTELSYCYKQKYQEKKEWILVAPESAFDGDKITCEPAKNIFDLEPEILAMIDPSQRIMLKAKDIPHEDDADKSHQCILMGHKYKEKDQNETTEILSIYYKVFAGFNNRADTVKHLVGFHKHNIPGEIHYDFFSCSDTKKGIEEEKLWYENERKSLTNATIGNEKQNIITAELSIEGKEVNENQSQILINDTDHSEKIGNYTNAVIEEEKKLYKDHGNSLINEMNQNKKGGDLSVTNWYEKVEYWIAIIFVVMIITVFYVHFCFDENYAEMEENDNEHYFASNLDFVIDISDLKLMQDTQININQNSAATSKDPNPSQPKSTNELRSSSKMKMTEESESENSDNSNHSQSETKVEDSEETHHSQSDTDIQGSEDTHHSQSETEVENSEDMHHSQSESEVQHSKDIHSSQSKA